MSKKDIASLVLEELEVLNVRSNRLKLLKALIKSKDLDKGMTHSDIAELMDLTDPSIDQSSRQTIKRSIKYLDESLEENRLRIEKRLIENGLSETLCFEKIDAGGGSGNNAIYMVKVKAIDKGDSAILQKANEGGDISYSLTEILKLPFWARPFSRIQLKGWIKAVYILLPLIAGFAFIPLSIYLIKTGDIVSVTAISAVMVCAYFLFKPFYSVLDTGVVRAPEWMLPMTELSGLLVKNSTEEGKVLILTQYKGVCPLCSGSVDIVVGKGQHKNRLIGQCEMSGQEHIYSFDHITKVGFHLGEPGYSKLLKNGAG